MKDKFAAQQWDDVNEQWVDIISVDHDNPHAEGIVTNVAKTFKMTKPHRRVRIINRYVSDVLVEEVD